ncbi:E3 ubiquitin protein ligase DRIP2-like isoform X2 [Ananas comosus]|uniref:E3 ubiquitin protein ligase DRIP2-like isoform X2 n=1 Tax=Ananas comosus TaxID=4615 RepID=A0A6P5FEZ0_ANACO|nr:E3 ubiquitin protein ligase DRIP2-like isoform X2 [Ananas comosus]
MAAAAEPSSPPPPPQVVRVRRELLTSRMTCPLCNKLLREATTISECLHTFCRKCIFEKLNDEEFDCCPTCNIDLGCLPVEKLRPDHNLQDIRAKIFPFKRRKINAAEVPPITLPVRRKERSLSSLVISTPRVAAQTSLTGRRTKAARRASASSRGIGSTANESAKEANNVEDRDESKKINTSETLMKMAQNKKQNNLDPETSNQAFNKDTENGRESYMDKAELWKPLNCLVEAANRTKALRSSPQRPIVKEEQINESDNGVMIHKSKFKEHLNKSKAQIDRNGSDSVVPPSAKPKKLQGLSRKRREIDTSAQALLDAASTQRDRRTSPVWFSLVASTNQETHFMFSCTKSGCIFREGDALLPQLSANYLRIKDGNLPISSIQKYLATKLELASEKEVEIVCRGKPMSPTMNLHSLVDVWLRSESAQKTCTSVGSSAMDFVMVLNYRRKISSS